MFLNTPPASPPKTPIITVWIHGTKPHEFLPPGIAHLARTLEKQLFSCKDGLHKIDSLALDNYTYILARTLSQTDDELFPFEHFYTFGWSGKLDPQARKIASRELFDSLKTLTLSYLEKFEIHPKIFLISHSHGGNVILGMAEHKIIDNFNLKIEKAILLACPVQKHTSHLAQSNMFGHVYSLHSHTDLIQIADPQGFHKLLLLKKEEKKIDFKKITRPLLSERHFSVHPKIVQACIRWKNCPLWNPQDHFVDDILLRPLTQAIKKLDLIKKSRGLFHVEFKLLPFIRQLPFIIKELDACIENTSHCKTNNDPDIILEL